MGAGELFFVGCVVVYMLADGLLTWAIMKRARLQQDEIERMKSELQSLDRKILNEAFRGL